MTEPRFLDGVVVVDFSTTLPGPYCTSLLLRLGARVFAIEPPGGDSLRLQPSTYRAVARGKESVVLNLKQQLDREFALSLVETADIVVEGWRPGVADRLGVGFDTCSARKPDLVYCSLSGFGATGEMAKRAAHDLNFLAEVGATEMARDVTLPLGDFASGMMGAIRILAALMRAKLSGAGAFLDVSAAGAVWDWVNAIGGSAAHEFVAEVASYPHYGRFATRDGRTLILGVCSEDKLWRALALALALDHVADLPHRERLARGAEIRRLVERAVASYTLEELEQRLAAVDTAWNVEHPAGSVARFSGALSVDAREPPELDGGRAGAEELISGTSEGRASGERHE